LKDGVGMEWGTWIITVIQNGPTVEYKHEPNYIYFNFHL